MTWVAVFVLLSLPIDHVRSFPTETIRKALEKKRLLDRSKESNSSFVYSWFNPKDQLREQQQLELSISSLNLRYPGIPKQLFTNVNNFHHDSLIIHQISAPSDHTPDLAHSLLYGLLSFSFDKHSNSIVGWEKRLLPEVVVHLDRDVVLLNHSSGLGVVDLFQDLLSYDLVATMSMDPSAMEVHSSWSLDPSLVGVRRGGGAELLALWDEQCLRQRSKSSRQGLPHVSLFFLDLSP
jgi:hypothetical protein